MSEDVKQTATDETDSVAKQTDEGTGAQGKDTDDFDKALAEFGETETKASSEQQKPSGAKADDDTLDRLKRLESKEADRIYREDLGKLVTEVRGDFTPDEVDDEFIETWLNANAKKDVRLANAWLKRHDDPAGFKRVAKGLTQKFAEKHARLRARDQDATDTKEVVTHAVQRGTGKPSGGAAPDFSKMTDREFAEAVKKEYGFRPL